MNWNIVMSNIIKFNDYTKEIIGRAIDVDGCLSIYCKQPILLADAIFSEMLSFYSPNDLKSISLKDGSVFIGVTNEFLIEFTNKLD